MPCSKSLARGGADPAARQVQAGRSRNYNCSQDFRNNFCFICGQSVRRRAYKGFQLASRLAVALCWSCLGTRRSYQGEPKLKGPQALGPTCKDLSLERWNCMPLGLPVVGIVRGRALAVLGSLSWTPKGFDWPTRLACWSETGGHKTTHQDSCWEV